MKKFLLNFMFIIFLCFAIPILISKEFKEEKIEVVEVEANPGIINDEIGNEKIVSKTIRLLHKTSNDTQEVELEEYLYGVVSSEMPAIFELEALKAQAVVARTYTIFKVNEKKHEEADICDDSGCCQAWISKEDRLSKWNEDKRNEYWNKIVEAVDKTKGEIITYNGQPINAFFHANSGGVTEIPYNVWGGSGYPYLQSVATSGEDVYSQYASEIILKKQEFIAKIKDKHKDFKINFEESDCIKIEEKTEGGRVKTIKIGNLSLSGVEIRTIIGLKSANFEVSNEGETIKFTVKGYGHGVGMSQTGADSLAKQGKNYEDIIKHYYIGIEVVQL